MASSTGQPTLRIYLFDSPRTCSQLVRKMFESHPQLEPVTHYFAAPALYGPERLGAVLKHCEAAEETQKELAVSYPDRNGFTYEQMAGIQCSVIDGLESRGKIMFGKDHAIMCFRRDVVTSVLRDPAFQVKGNPTFIADPLVESLTPIFLIRHPALIWPSWWKVQFPVFKYQVDDEDFRGVPSLRWTKILFDYYRSNGKEPIVVDAEDLVNSPAALIEKLCGKLGIDPSGVKTEWDAESPPDDKQASEFMKQLLTSRGIEQTQTREKNFDLAKLAAKWDEEYGEDAAGNSVGEALQKIVEQETPIYDYLRNAKLQV